MENIRYQICANFRGADFVKNRFARVPVVPRVGDEVFFRDYDNLEIFKVEYVLHSGDEITIGLGFNSGECNSQESWDYFRDFLARLGFRDETHETERRKQPIVLI